MSALIKAISRQWLNEEIFKLDAYVSNFNCSDSTTYAVPGVPISNTSCDDISFIDGLLPIASSSASELDILGIGSLGEIT